MARSPQPAAFADSLTSHSPAARCATCREFSTRVSQSLQIGRAHLKSVDKQDLVDEVRLG